MIEGLFFALDIFFAVALVYWVYAADSAPGEDPKGLFRWIQRKRDQRPPAPQGMVHLSNGAISENIDA